MVKGKRAADRRREREGHDFDQLDDVDAEAVTGMLTDKTKRELERSSHKGKRPKSRISEEDFSLNSVAERSAVEEFNEETQKHIVNLPKRLDGGSLLTFDSPRIKTILKETPFIIGRGSKVSYLLDLPEVSRRHARLYYSFEESTWWIENLSVTVGTMVNGFMVSNSEPLKHGDLIEIGTIAFRFLAHEEEPQISDELEEEKKIEDATNLDGTIQSQLGMTERQRQRFIVKQKVLNHLKDRKKLISLILMLGISIAIVVSSYYALSYQQHQSALQEKTVSLQKAEIHYKEKRFLEARSILEPTLAELPNDADVQSLMRMVDGELEAKQNLKEAKEMWHNKDEKKALSSLYKIPNSSVYAEEAYILIDDIEGNSSKLLNRQIQDFINKRQFKKAITKLLEYIDKNKEHAFAEQLLEQVQILQKKPPPKHTSIKEAEKYFAKGQLNEVYKIVNQGNAKGQQQRNYYKRKLQNFMSAYEKGKNALKKKSEKTAVSQLSESLSLGNTLGAHSFTSFGKEIRRNYANALFLKAMNTYSKGKKCEWAASIFRASQLNGNDQKIKLQKRKILAIAQEKLEMARLQKTNPLKSKSLAKEGLCFSPQKSTLRRQLKKYIH